MNKKIENIINSIDNLKKAKAKPYFYTRLSAKLERRIKKENFHLKYERLFLFVSIILLLIINAFIIYDIDEIENKITDEEIYFDERNLDIVNFTNYEE